jgi:hypothetical protein
MFYYANRLNTIFAKALLSKKKNTEASFTNLYINLFTKNTLVPRTVFSFLKTNTFFKKTVITYFIKKKIFFKEKKKKQKSFFFFKKKKTEKINYFKNKKSCNFIFVNFLKKNNFLTQKTEFSSCFLFYLINFKFFTNELFNYLKITVNEADTSKVICFFFLKIFKQFNCEQVNSITFYNINKFSDFWSFISKISSNFKPNLKVVPSYLTVLSTQEKAQLEPFNVEFKDFLQQDSSKVLTSFFFKKKETKPFNNENLKIPFDFFFFFRKNNLYNKGKFSRNRQTYRTGVFLCIWLTVLTVIGMYFYFLMLSIKFTYLFFFFLAFIALFFYKYWFLTAENKIENHTWLFFY